MEANGGDWDRRCKKILANLSTWGRLSEVQMQFSRSLWWLWSALPRMDDPSISSLVSLISIWSVNLSWYQFILFTQWIIYVPVIVYLTFGIRMGSLTATELCPNSYSSSVVAAAYEANSLTLKLDEQLPIWKLRKTETYLKFEKCIDFLHQEGESLLKRWEKLADDERVRCLMDDYKQDPNLTRKGLKNNFFKMSFQFNFLFLQICPEQRKNFS